MLGRLKSWLITTGWLPFWLHSRWQHAQTEALLTSIFGPRCSDA